MGSTRYGTDTQYVLMLIAAKEIQAMRPVGQWWKDEDEIALLHAAGTYELIHPAWGLVRDETIGLWYPSQHQLQAMIEWTPRRLWEECQILDAPDYVFALTGYAKECKSWEQLWLAIVMHEKHGKRWTGDEWVSDKQPDDCPFAKCDRDVVRDFCPQGCQPYQIFKRGPK